MDSWRIDDDPRATSGYLQRPLRTYEQALRELSALRVDDEESFQSTGSEPVETIDR